MFEQIFHTVYKKKLYAKLLYIPRAYQINIFFFVSATHNFTNTHFKGINVALVVATTVVLVNTTRI